MDTEPLKTTEGAEIQQENLPVTDEITPNELPGESPTQPSTSITEKIGNAASGVFEKFGLPFKRGRGRPRKDGQPKGNDLVLTDAGPVPAATLPAGVAAPAVVPAVDYSARIALFRRSLVAAAKGALEIVKSVIRIKAGAAGIDEKFTDEQLKADSPDTEALDDFSQSLEAVLDKHNVKPENAEEIALAVNTARLLGPFMLLWTAFNAEIKRNRERDEKKAAA